MEEPSQQPPVEDVALSGQSHHVAEAGTYTLAPKPKKHWLKPVLIVLLVLIVLAALAGGGYWFWTHHKSTKSDKPAAQTQETQPATTESTPTTDISATTKHYDSTNFNLAFDYPQDWTVSEAATGKLTATSPAVQLEDANGQTFTGQIVFTIQSKQTTVPQIAAGHAVAALASQKIVYKHPTSNQRAQTYISFMNYTGGTQGIDALYVAGDNGYQAAQSIPVTDVVQADPLVNFSFVKCGNAACPSTGTTTATSIAASSWKDSSLSAPLISLLESLVIN